jgi:hypothetical protein
VLLQPPGQKPSRAGRGSARAAAARLREAGDNSGNNDLFTKWLVSNQVLTPYQAGVLKRGHAAHAQPCQPVVVDVKLVALNPESSSKLFGLNWREALLIGGAMGGVLLLGVVTLLVRSLM